MGRQAKQMRRRWSRFAREAPMFYIHSRRDDWTEAEFFATGAEAAAPVIEWGRRIRSQRRVLEIGCGLGRVLVHIAPYFEHAEGVDIAPEMVAAAAVHGHLPDNVRVSVTNGVDLQGIDDGSVDLAYSLHVFQHIPDQQAVAGYVSEVARILSPGGGAWLHFDTRPKTIGSRSLRLVPDLLLPRTRRRFIRRYRLPASAPEQMALEAGLEVAEERSRGTESHVVILRNPGSGPTTGR